MNPKQAENIKRLLSGNWTAIEDNNPIKNSGGSKPYFIPCKERVFTGKDFKYIFKNFIFIKLTNEIESHNGLQYCDGLNVDNELFNPSGSNNPGGIYFIEEREIPNWIGYNSKVNTMVYKKCHYTRRCTSIYRSK